MIFDRTEQEKMMDFIRPQAETQEDMILRLIKEHEARLDEYSIGELYYNNQPDILREEVPVDATGQIDPLKPDNRMFLNYHKLLTDQEVSYIAGNPVTVKHEDENVVNAIYETLSNRFDNRLITILTTAINKGVEWIHLYIDEEGKLNTMRIPREQAIPIYNNREKERLDAFIWVYMLDGAKRVAYFTPEDVTYYMFYDAKLVLDYYEGEVNPTTHFNEGSWGRVPFVPFRNNEQETSNIHNYKTLIDALNRRLSDLQNSFDDTSESIYVLKNYEAENLSDFKRLLRYYGAIKVDEDGGVDVLGADVPVSSSKEYIDMLHEKIILAAQGVDFNTDRFGNSPSGIALRFLFSDLDMKARRLASEAHIALQEIIWFVYEHNNLKGDYRDVEITFNFNQMTNQLEDSQIAVQSIGIISKETIVEHHPWTKDLQGEMERIEAEQMEVNNTLPQIEVINDESGTN